MFHNVCVFKARQRCRSWQTGRGALILLFSLSGLHCPKSHITLVTASLSVVNGTFSSSLILPSTLKHTLWALLLIRGIFTFSLYHSPAFCCSLKLCHEREYTHIHVTKALYCICSLPSSEKDKNAINVTQK